MPSAHVNGIDLYYERTGHGPPLLFLNGSGSTLATVAPLIDMVAGRLEVVAHDHPGLGRSSIPVGPYTLAQYASDALGLLGAVGWSMCRVVGVSFGGMVAQELAVTAPERVERLALVCTSPGGEGGASYPLDELVGLVPPRRAEISRQLLDPRFTEEWLSSHRGDRMLADAMAQRGADGIAPVANSEAIVSVVAGATLHVYEGGHAFFVQDRRAMPETIDFLAG
ncbi:MAG TPA: alpha/beta hydrolase [Acidimicrobiales bacterium]|nr:alpha/beta hydrolase [Acidimicrobiales bacterium]